LPLNFTQYTVLLHNVEIVMYPHPMYKVAVVLCCHGVMVKWWMELGGEGNCGSRGKCNCTNQLASCGSD